MLPGMQLTILLQEKQEESLKLRTVVDVSIILVLLLQY